MTRLEKVGGQMRNSEGDQADDHDHGRDGQCDRETSGVFRTEPVDEPEEEQHRDRRQRDVVLEELEPHDLFGAGDDIGQAGPAAERGGDGQVGDEKQRADDCEQTSLRSRGGIDAASVRESTGR